MKLLLLTLLIALCPLTASSQPANEPVEVISDEKELTELTKQLENLTITWPAYPGRQFPLKDGRFLGHDDVDSTIEIDLRISHPKVFFKDGDGTFAIAVFWIRLGGTGSWETIKQIRLSPRPVREIHSWPVLKDRERVMSLGIAAREVTVQQMVHKKDDASCCATGEKTFKLKLVKDTFR